MQGSLIATSTINLKAVSHYGVCKRIRVISTLKHGIQKVGRVRILQYILNSECKKIYGNGRVSELLRGLKNHIYTRGRQREEEIDS